MSAPEQAAPSSNTAAAEPLVHAASPVLGARMDFLYRLGRHHLCLAFVALLVVVSLYTHRVSTPLVVLGLAIQVAAILVMERLAETYAVRAGSGAPEIWARRYVIASAVTGAAWGISAFIWFIPHSIPAEAFLTVTFLGMTACEYIARSVYRPAYLAHTSLSLGPLAALLVHEGNLCAVMFAAVALLFAAVLFSYCEDLARRLDERVRLQEAHDDLVRRLGEEKLAAERARDTAETSVRAKSLFIANISHELRTPLNALLGMAQLLDRSELDRAQKSHVKVLLEAGRGLKTLLDDVIALSQDGEESRVQDECDAAHAVRTVGRLLQPLAWEKQLRLSVSAPSELPRAASDPRRIRQVLLKLADNAVKFTQRGSVEIVVAAQTREDGTEQLRFEVSDTGLGIPPEVAAHIFEPFLAGDGSYARRYTGTGLGLAVAKQVVEQMGGQIGFVSEPGEGALFWFTVPALRDASAPGEEQGPVAGDVSPPSGLHLLVWIAEEGQRVQLANLLEPFGNRLTFARDVQDVIARGGRERFDAVMASAADADMIVAAPGRKRPMLALLGRGMRTPAAADQVLRWPARGGALYAALRDLLGRGADSGLSRSDEETMETAAIDATAFAALEKSLGMATLVEILHSYMQTAEGLCASLRSAADGESWEEAARISQDIAGAAGGLGLAALTTAARGFTQKAREPSEAQELHEAAETVVGEHRRVRRALGHLYPELAA
jgi:signal transduction histidine kinase/HPt (histidine-containing phosphotransfer) domain-containing protein